MIILHLKSLHDYKMFHISFRLLSIFVKKFLQPLKSNIFYRCSEMFQSAGQPSHPESVITDFKKYYWKNFYHEFLPVVQLEPLPDK